MDKRVGLVLCLLALAAGRAVADDIDIYLDGAARGKPYVLLMLDLRASTYATACDTFAACAPPYMSAAAYDRLADFGDFDGSDPVSHFEVFRAVLAAVLDGEAFDDIHLAIVAGNRAEGGTVLQGYQSLGAHRAGLVATLAALPAHMAGSEAHAFGAMESYYEWFRYITGGDVLFGQSTSGNFRGTQSPDYHASIISGGRYVPPLRDPQACPRLFSMALTLQAVSESQDGAADTAIGSDPYLGASPGFPGGGFRRVEDMLAFMHAPTTDLLPVVEGIQPLEKSWVISDGDGIGETAGMARAGGSGAPLSLGDPRQLERELTNMFSEAVSVSSTLVAASVPVNVYNRAEALDNLYIALFEAQSTLRWPGNVKKLKLVDTFDARAPGNSTGRDGVFDAVVDARGKAAFESTGENRGRIAFDALTFWTEVATLPPPGADPAVPRNADGRVVARGGAGQQIPGFVDDGTFAIGDHNSAGTRNLYVEPGVITNGVDNSLVPFNASTATLASVPYLSSALGTSTNAEAMEMIRWARGQDRDDSDGDGNTGEARAWILADAIHSRPAALNYGATAGYSTDNPNIRLFFGTGGGIFHVLENTDSEGNQSGRELYGFLPRETLGVVPLKRANTEPAAKMRYGVDGAPVTMTRDINGDGNLVAGDGDEAYVYFGLRRGGTRYYALDVSDPAQPPGLKWKIGPTPGGGFEELGLTFSEPVVGRVRYGEEATDVVIFAGGYHGGWNESYTARVGKDAGAADDPVGNAIYIVDARSGALIWKAVHGVSTGSVGNTEYRHAGLVDSIPSRVSVLRDNSGNIHRLYVGDTGGAVWRVDLPVGSGTDHRADHWFISKLAELGADGAVTDRRFFHAPDLVQVIGPGKVPFDGVLIASGNRAAPNETAVTNYLFYLKDHAVESGDVAVKSRPPLTLADLSDQSACVTGEEAAGCAGPMPRGWALELARAGEKGLSTPLTDGGRVFLSTFVPASGAAACEPTEGEGSVYVINLSDATAVDGGVRFHDIGPGIPPGAVLVGDAILVPGGGIDLGDLDGDRDGAALPPVKGPRLFRIYWREPGVDKL